MTCVGNNGCPSGYVCKSDNSGVCVTCNYDVDCSSSTPYCVSNLCAAAPSSTVASTYKTYTFLSPFPQVTTWDSNYANPSSTEFLNLVAAFIVYLKQKLGLSAPAQITVTSITQGSIGRLLTRVRRQSNGINILYSVVTPNSPSAIVASMGGSQIITSSSTIQSGSMKVIILSVLLAFIFIM